MKTTIKTLLLAAILVLAVLSCAPEVEMSSRDFDAIKGVDSALSEIDYSDMEPIRITNSLTNSAVQFDEDKQITIWLPKEADVLRKTNAEMSAGLAAFMKAYAIVSAPTPMTSGFETPTLGAEIPYTFVKRTVNNSGGFVGFNVTIQLNAVPNANVVLKIDAAQYTFNRGKKLSNSDDTWAGTAYNDVYLNVPVTSSVVGFQGGTYSNPYKTWRLTLSSPSFDAITGAGVVESNARLDSIATLIGLPGLSSGTTYDTDTMIKNAELRGLVGKFHLEKFATDSWVDAGGTFAYVDIATGSTASYQGYITLSSTPEKFTAYRIRVDGTENLETSGTYYNVKQRIRVGGSYNNKSVVTAVSYYEGIQSGPANEYMSWVTGTNSSGSLVAGNNPVTSTEVQYDKGNSLILLMTFSPLSVPGELYYRYIKEMSLAEFQKNVKIFYSTDTNAISAPSALANKDLKNIAFLDITAVKYGDTLHYNEITVTATVENRYTPSKTLYLALAPGFTYNSDKIVFGNYSNVNIVIDGVRFFDYYGAIN
jgi:hypothetical protein